MQEPENMKRDLSYVLWAELQRKLLSGESVTISLPGSIGEAFVLTDKRAIILRETPDAIPAACDVIAYNLDNVVGATIGAHASGGYLDIQLHEPPKSAEAVRVYFGLVDAEQFAEASKLVSESAVQCREKAEVYTVKNDASRITCQDCDAAVEISSVFCHACGGQLRLICGNCGSTSIPGANFCTSCGRDFVEFIPKCPACQCRVGLSAIYCNQCGQVMKQLCAVCGSDVHPSWKRCATCGRALGSVDLDPRTVRRIQNRVEQIREQQDVTSVSYPEIVSDNMAAKPEYYNSRGLDYYNNEQYDAAIEEFKNAISASPQNASYHCNLALAYDENDQDDLALLEYRKTLELDSSDTTALLSLGYLYSENEDAGKALEMWKRVIDVAPGTAEAQEAQENIRHQGQL